MTTMEHAAEIDTKLGIIRRKVANFACGYTPETTSRVQPAKEYLTSASKDLEEFESKCSEFVRTSEALDSLIQEADDMVSNIFARLSEAYADFGMDMPTFEDEEIPVGIPLEKLVLEDKGEEPEQTIIGTPSELATSDDSASDVDFKPNIFITRPSDSGGPPTWTPMIKTKVSRTVGVSRLAID